MYKLDNDFTRGDFAVTIVGCGGTGGFAADSICRLLPPRACLLLVDHDRVEEGNLTRQNFSREDLGKFKSEALALRFARKYGRPVAYSTLPVAGAAIKVPGVIIGCVDNGPARREIAEKVKGSLFVSYRYPSWWVDAGNGDNYGQVLIGNAPKRSFFDPEQDTCTALPLPTIQRPDLLSQVPPRQPGCAQMDGQGPTINQAMASVVVEVVRRLIEGTCPWMQLYLDLEGGTLHPVLATPEAVQKITGGRIKNNKKEVKHER